MKIIIGIILVISFISFAQEKDKKNENVQENENSSFDPRKTYTKAEFDAEVMKAVEKNMRRLGRSSIINFSKELIKKEDDLKVKELNFQKQKESLKIIKEQLDKKLTEIDKKQTNIISCLDQRDKDKQKRVGHMVDVVAGMRPANAASVLSVQDPSIAVHILGLLDPNKVSKIFNLMDKEISARLQKQYMTMKR